MQIGFLTSGKIAIPAIHALAQHRLLAWVAVPNDSNESIAELLAYLKGAQIRHFLIEKSTFHTQIEEMVQKEAIFSVFVLGFPWKIKPSLLNAPETGCWNFHFGSLPHYRGNAPVFWQIRNQEPTAAVSVHQMSEGFDEGALFHVEKTPIAPNDTFGSIEKKLTFAAVNAMNKLIPALFNDKLALTAQNAELASVYKKPTANEVCISWQTQTAQAIKALVQATNPWNKGAYTLFQGQYIRFLQVSILENKRNIQAKAGTIIKADAEGLWAMCSNNLLLSIDIVYVEEGYFTGTQFVKLGANKNMMFE